MSSQPNPDERFDRVESILNQLSNSFRHLLTAQVLMNDRLDSRGNSDPEDGGNHEGAR